MLDQFGEPPILAGSGPLCNARAAYNSHMPKEYLERDLARYGPDQSQEVPVGLEQAYAYCRQLAAGHYENFTVASFLMPQHLRQHFCVLYAYCRWADDLADEIQPRERALALLDWWEKELNSLFEPDKTSANGRHPVFIALASTIEEFDLPRQPLVDLLIAFRQDQAKTRYETFAELLNYCQYSANPVGRLVLYLGRCHSEETARLSDSICTGLQLANFWQDVARDFQSGRIYLPQEDLRRFGYPENEFSSLTATDSFRELLKFQVDRAERFLRDGIPLVPLVSQDLRLPVRLFLDGGLAIIAAIRRQRYDVWSRRPTVGKGTRLWLLARAFLRRNS